MNGGLYKPWFLDEAIQVRLNTASTLADEFRRSPASSRYENGTGRFLSSCWIQGYVVWLILRLFEDRIVWRRKVWLVNALTFWQLWPDFDSLILRVLEGFWSRGLYRWVRLVEFFALVYCLTHFGIVDFWSTQRFSSFDLGWLGCKRLSSCCKCLADFSRV